MYEAAAFTISRMTPSTLLFFFPVSGRYDRHPEWDNSLF